MTRSGELRALAQRIADAFPPQVIDVVLTGSVSRGLAEEQPLSEEPFELAATGGARSSRPSASRRRPSAGAGSRREVCSSSRRPSARHREPSAR